LIGSVAAMNKAELVYELIKFYESPCPPLFKTHIVSKYLS